MFITFQTLFFFLRGCTNVLEAVSHGASCAVSLVANIVVNLIAFLALLAFFDAALSWLGGMLDCPQLSFSVMRRPVTTAFIHPYSSKTNTNTDSYMSLSRLQLICSYVFMPLSFMLGVSWEDSFLVAELIGTKTFLNEFVAYQRLSELIKKRKAGGPEYVNNLKQFISVSPTHHMDRSHTVQTIQLNFLTG